MFKVTVVPGNSYVGVRSQPSTSAAKLGTLYAPAYALGPDAPIKNAMGEDWIRVTEVDGVPMDGYIAVFAAGQTWSVVTEEGAPPPSGEKVTVKFTLATPVEIFVGDKQVYP